MARARYKYKPGTMERARCRPRSPRYRRRLQAQKKLRLDDGSPIGLCSMVSVVAHGTLEVAEEQTRPATTASDVGRLNERASFVSCLRP